MGEEKCLTLVGRLRIMRGLGLHRARFVHRVTARNFIVELRRKSAKNNTSSKCWNSYDQRKDYYRYRWCRIHWKSYDAMSIRSRLQRNRCR